MISVSASTRPGNSTAQSTRMADRALIHTGSTDGCTSAYPSTEMYGTVIKGASPGKGRSTAAWRWESRWRGCGASCASPQVSRKPGCTSQGLLSTALPGSPQAHKVAVAPTPPEPLRLVTGNTGFAELIIPSLYLCGFQNFREPSFLCEEKQPSFILSHKSIKIKAAQLVITP